MQKYIEASTLSSWLKSPDRYKRGIDFAIIDVRDSDFIGGHIVSAINVPSSDVLKNPAALYDQVSEAKIVIFHCALSQVRGPKSAAAYQRVLLEKAGGDSEKLCQQVLVLRGGFTQWQGHYGHDKDLTVEYDAELWRGNF
jgi:rhodanese-related sulfurtransferase